MADDFTLGGYRRINVVQTGQNSEVWEVVDSETNKRFAMKLLLPEKVDDPDQQFMLKHEAAIGMKLSHPKIIRFFKYVRSKSTPFILMENFSAPNLKLRLMRGQFNDFIKPRLRQIIKQVGSALSYLHEKGWVHRDIKPDNILINNQGDVRLIDFALAVRTAGVFARRFGKRGRTAGTRSYMSPEQIYGLPLDCRADIYSLGVVLYEAVTGRLPFVASSANMLLQKHITEPPPPMDSATNLMPPFEMLIFQMLAKKPDKRPKTIDEVLAKIRDMKKLFKDEKEAAEGSDQ